MRCAVLVAAAALWCMNSAAAKLLSGRLVILMEDHFDTNEVGAARPQYAVMENWYLSANAVVPTSKPSPLGP